MTKVQAHALDQLAATIAARRRAQSDASYTRQLLDAGPEKCARKFSEESTELLIAAVSQGADAVRDEAADVLYHLIVLLEARGVAFSDVCATLEKRTAQSGVAEKASRGVKS
jgi:phosphoribosyl-ATP pyrophosphohydrolase